MRNKETRAQWKDMGTREEASEQSLLSPSLLLHLQEERNTSYAPTGHGDNGLPTRPRPRVNAMTLSSSRINSNEALFSYHKSTPPNTVTNGGKKWGMTICELMAERKKR